MSDANKIAQRIKERRVALRMKQQELATGVGVSVVTITRWEKGTRTPNSSMMSKLAEKLQTSIGYLLGETDTPNMSSQTVNFIPEVNTNKPNDNISYWGNFLDNVQNVAKSGNLGEISLVESFLNSAFSLLSMGKAQVAHAGTIPEKSINFNMRHNYMNGTTFDA